MKSQPDDEPSRYEIMGINQMPLPKQMRFKISPLALKVIQGEWTDNYGKDKPSTYIQVRKIRDLIKQLQNTLTNPAK